MTDEVRPAIDAGLVARLVAAQFPAWASLPVRPVSPQGNDNRTFRLGDELVARLPSAAGYVPAVEKEDLVLPRLAGALPVAVPAPVATGAPGEGYPFPWSVRRWLPGTTADADPALDRDALACDLGAFLVALRGLPTAGGPVAGPHSFFRGEHPRVYDDEVRAVLAALRARQDDGIDVDACAAVWGEVLATGIEQPDGWFHGDIGVGNLLTVDGRLSAVIDFGTCGVGDPACDLVIAWTLFDAAERRLFAAAVDLPPATWRLARGWALWKALITVTGAERDTAYDRYHRAIQERTIRAVLADPVAG
ncbi:aminoglycoside phosphotransferase family protein [Tersicoccus sp. Bi-70]|uniref:aminoglycoside phosphotransferase family protein n=1 Tax=Tersicoccus sp. Bi-70 TaxID=1897634 RepID=UPI000977A15C|nr:aminoglycoside phosphotransferase family protein [Tersicoccus sp. Bi-70]OMH34850.1 acetyltransferase [Tersicoccus sp. Bi-70]